MSGIDFTNPDTGGDMFDEFLADRREANAGVTVNNGGEQVALNDVVKGAESHTGVADELAVRADQAQFQAAAADQADQDDRATIEDWQVLPDGKFQLLRTDGRIEVHQDGSVYPDFHEKAQELLGEQRETVISAANEVLDLAEQYGGVGPFFATLTPEQGQWAGELISAAFYAEEQSTGDTEPDEDYVEQFHASLAPDESDPDAHPLDEGLEDWDLDRQVNQIAKADPSLQLGEDWARVSFLEILATTAEGDFTVATQLWKEALTGDEAA